MTAAGTRKLRAFAHVAAGTATAAALFLVAERDYLLFHVVAELFSIIIACALFLLAWNTRNYSSHPGLTCLGMVYLFIGLLDLAHMLSYEGMSVIKGYGYPANQLWIAARSMEALALAIFLSTPSKRFKIQPLTVFFAAGAVATLALASVFVWKIFPTCYVKGDGQTHFKIAAEYAVIAVLAAALCGLWRNRADYPRDIMAFLASSVLATMASEFCFTLYISNYGFFNICGHILKILSFFLIYKGVIESGLRKPFGTIFKRLKDDETLHMKTQELAKIGGWDFDMQTKGFSCTGELRRILGIPGDWDYARTFAFISSPAAGAMRQPMKSLLEEGKPFDIETEVETPAGAKIWVRSIGESEFSERGGLARCRGMVQDIANLKEAERMREEVECISRHDLKTPLNAIIGFSDLLLEDGERIPEPKRMEYVRYVNESGRRLLDMVTMSLHLLKMERGDYKVRQTCLDLQSIAEKVLTELSSLSEMKELRISVATQKSLPPSNCEVRFPAMGEEMLCHSLLANLLKNAMEASPRGGSVEISFARQEDRTFIKIKNHGVPPASMRDKFFEKYSSAGKSGGTGLGNYSAKLMARTQGGDVSMECSDAENSTVMTVSMPSCCLRRAAAARAAEPDA